MKSLPKIDAHHHLWDLDNNPYPWLQGPMTPRNYGDYSEIRRNYLYDDFKRDSEPHNVRKSVHVQANWDSADPVGETRWVQQVADKHDVAQAIVAHADLSAPDVEETLRAHCEFGNMRGIRQIIGHTDDPDCARPNPACSPDFRRGYALLERFGLSFDLQAYARQVADFLQVAEHHPEVSVIVCHTGFPYHRDEAGLAAWREAMASLASLPNAFAKLSGPAMVMPDWTVQSFGPFVHETIELFGPSRCMFASNLPPDRLSKSYDEIFESFYVWAADYTEQERAQLFHDTAERAYRI
ncbi:MAG: amidohydrolase family protein [Gammaproteobacteria bacterium]